MKIDLLDVNTYALFDDKGVEIEKGAILPEWREKQRSQKKGLRAVIAEAKKVKVSQPLAVQVEGETVVVVPVHEHEYDERYSSSEHEHDYAATGHNHGTHSHDEFSLFKAAIEAESRDRYKGDQQAEAKYRNHLHPELAQAFHTHEDIYATFNVINQRITAAEGRIPTEILPHQHNDLLEAINLLRSEVQGLRREVGSLGNKVEAEDTAIRALIETRIADCQPKGEYVTREEMNPLTQHKRAYRVKVKSQQNVDGSTFMNLEEV